jgi:2-iminobutanoate/2-iminopropanoate deaminase
MLDALAGKRRRVLAPTSNEPGPDLWSNCFVIDRFVVIAGMTARNLDGSRIGVGDPYQQAVASFARMRAYMEAAGGTMADVIKMTAYLTDVRYRPDFIKARREVFSGDFPPCVVVGNCTLANPDALVEIDAWAILGSGGGAPSS